MNAQWRPNVTVAAVIERDGRFLLVEEETPDGLRLNQPAGHLEQGESLTDACARETLEESAWHFVPGALVGIYLWPRPQGEAVKAMAARSPITYLRFAFCGELGAHEERALDTGIVRALWLSPEEIAATRERHRSPLILQCVADHLAGRRYPLDLLHHYL